MDSSTNKKVKSKIIDFLSPINEYNFEQFFDDFLKLILSFRGRIKKDNIIEILLEIRNSIELNEGQDELICDLENRLVEFCSSKDIINWD